MACHSRTGSPDDSEAIFSRGREPGHAMSSLTNKAGFLIAANFIKYAVGFTLPMLMVRLLDKGDYGTYQQLLLVNSMALGLLTMGVPSSIYYFYNRISETGKK